MSAPTLTPMSVEEYLRTEETSPYKREYVGGYVYPLHGASRAQAGASGPHVRIAQNFVVALDAAAAQRGCRLYSTDMKLRIEQSNLFYYPDFMVVCGQTAHGYAVQYETAPCLLIEVLSRSTASIDRHAKYAAYTALPSLQTYLIVEQTMRQVYVYQRGETGWRSSEVTGQGSIDLPCLETTLTLDQIYKYLSV